MHFLQLVSLFYSLEQCHFAQMQACGTSLPIFWKELQIVAIYSYNIGIEELILTMLVSINILHNVLETRDLCAVLIFLFAVKVVMALCKLLSLYKLLFVLMGMS